jgi:hypothetical protein
MNNKSEVRTNLGREDYKERNKHSFKSDKLKNVYEKSSNINISYHKLDYINENIQRVKDDSYEGLGQTKNSIKESYTKSNISSTYDMSSIIVNDHKLTYMNEDNPISNEEYSVGLNYSDDSFDSILEKYNFIEEKVPSYKKTVTFSDNSDYVSYNLSDEEKNSKRDTWHNVKRMINFNLKMKSIEDNKSNLVFEDDSTTKLYEEKTTIEDNTEQNTKQKNRMNDDSRTKDRSALKPIIKKDLKYTRSI